MDFLAIAALFALLVISYFSIATRKSNAKGPEAPKVSGGWPLIGHLRLFGGSQLPHFNLGALADKYGPVFIVNIGVHPTMMVNTWEAAKDCYTINDLVISSRPMNVGTQLLTYNQAMLGFSPYGQYWRDIRKITVHELLSNRRLELLKHVRESEVEMTIKDLYKQWTRNGSSHILVEMKQWFMDLTLNVIFRMVAGKRYFHGNLSDGKEDRRCQKALREFFYYVGLFGLGDAVPWLKWLDLGGIQKATKQNAKELDSLVTEWLEEHKQRRAMRGDHNKQGKETEQDFMDVMLSALDGVDTCGFHIDTVMKSTILNLIAGGSDTTTVTLAWALAALLNDRRALNIVYEELDKHVGKGRLVNESDVNNLVYFQAVVKEAMRLYPTAPFAGYRMFTEDCKVAGYHVPKGTWLLVNLWKVQTDPRVYEDPMEFKPERFLTTHKDLDVKGQHFEFMPFGSGRRACPGIAFGMQMTHLTLASFLHAFEVSTPNNAPADMSGSIGLSNMKSNPLDVLIKPRLPPNVYE